jgi:hypothetical protein
MRLFIQSAVRSRQSAGLQLIIFVVLLLFSDSLHGQYAWNRETTHALGATSKPYAHLHTYADGTDYLYLTGHNALTDTTAQLQVTKLDDQGEIDDIIKTDGTNADLAFGVKGGLGADGFFYAVGGQRTTASQSVDVLVVKIQPSTGSIVWQTALTGGAVAKTDDLPTDFYVTHAGEVYLTGTAGVNGLNPNILTAKLNNNGSLAWLEVFNRANGIDAGFVIQPADTLVRVLGATHPAAGAWSVTSLRYEPSTGTLADTTFVGAGNVLFDDRIRFAAGTNRLYITGGTSTTGKQESEALGFTTSLNTVYQQDVDLFADRTDVTALYLDKTTDGLLLAGDGAINNQHYTTFLQHRAANGTATYSDTLKEGRSPTLLPHYLTEADSLLFLAGPPEKGAPTVVEVRDHARRRVGYLRPGLTAGATSEVTGVHRFGDKILVAGIERDGNGAEDYVTVFSLLRRDTAITVVREHTEHIRSEVIVNINPRLLDTAFIDNEDLQFGTVAEVVRDTGLINQLDQAINTGGDVSNWHLTKIFPYLHTYDTLGTTRQGHTFRYRPLWSRLMLVPVNKTAWDALTLSADITDGVDYSYIRYAHPDWRGQPAMPPNDPEFGQQKSLEDGVSSLLIPEHDINAIEAWTTMDSYGVTKWRNINIALFDTGVRFAHEDLRCEGCPGLTVPGLSSNIRSVVDKVYDVSEQSPIPKSIEDDPQDKQDLPSLGQVANLEDGHGTRTAGILAAIRNNSTGIAGLMNRYNATQYLGGIIYSYRFTENGNLLSDNSYAINHVLGGGSPADMDLLVHEFAMLDPGCPGNSSGDTTLCESIALARESTYEAYRQDRIQLTARGNFNDEQGSIPSLFPDAWLVSVGASDAEGFLAEGSSSAGNMDLLAPGTPDINYTTSRVSDSSYSDYSLTSAALPHAAGVAGLVQMVHQGPLYQEDIEHLLEFWATDDDANPGFDEDNGWGRLNAGETIAQLHDSVGLHHRVLHFDYELSEMDVTTETTTETIFFDFGFESVCSGEQGGVTGKRRKYSVNFNINLEALGVQLATPPLPGAVPYWVRNSQSNLWDIRSATDSIAPVNAAYLDPAVPVSYSNGVLSGRLTGWTLTETTNLPACGSAPETCDGEEVPRCYQGLPRLSLSVLVHGPIPHTVDKPSQSSKQFRIFPNPGHDRITVKSTSGERLQRVTIFSLSGRKVAEHLTTDNRMILDVASLPSGIYFIRVHTADTVSSQKFIRR